MLFSASSINNQEHCIKIVKNLWITLYRSNYVYVYNVQFWSYAVACMHAQLLSHVWLFVALQAPPLSKEFSKQKYRSGLLFPSPGDLPNLVPMFSTMTFLISWTSQHCAVILLIFLKAFFLEVSILLHWFDYSCFFWLTFSSVFFLAFNFKFFCIHIFEIIYIHFYIGWVFVF